MPYVSPSGAANANHVILEDALGPAPFRLPLIATDALRVVLYRTPPGTSFGRHHHPDCDETFHVLRGRALFRFDGGPEVDATPGSILFAARGIKHQIEVPGPEDFVWLAIVTPNIDTSDEQVEG